MNLQRCQNGHYYDGDRYASCPHCEYVKTEPASIQMSIAENNGITMPFSENRDEDVFEDDIPAELPSELSFFKLTEKLGTGSTGTVYRLEQKQAYAVKVIPRCSEQTSDRAKHEYDVAKELMDDRHFPNYYGMYQTDSHIFLLQDVERSWKEYTKQNPVTLEKVVSILKDVLLAMIAMHKKGLSHMDVKPDNIFVDSYDRGRLGDFSHSVRMNKGQRHTTVIGTDRFVAPEIILGQEYSGKEDMYSFGITMYMILTGGKCPYDYTGRIPACRRREDQILGDEQVPEALLCVIQKATAFDPGDRYVNLYEMLGDYMDAAEGMDQYLIAIPVKPLWESYQTDRTNGTVDPYGQQGTRVDEVFFGAFTDRSVRGDDYGIVEIAMYEEKYKETILGQIRDEFNTLFKEKTFHKANVRENQEITVRLSSREVDIEDDTVTLTWNGDGLLFTFDYYVPEDYRKKRIPFTADVYFDGVPATKLKFYVDVVSDGSEGRSKGPGECSDFQRSDVKRAFMSYASQDRNRVTAILQGIKKARPDMDVFFDVETLRSGQNWENALYAELLDRDILFLCWSHFALASAWVEKEWRFMLRKKGIDAIEPIPMEDPRFCPPPEELKEKHFNDLQVQYRKVAEPLRDDDWGW